MGTALVDSSKQLVPISLLNSDEEPKQSPKGYAIGVIEQVERAPQRDGAVLTIPENGPCESPIEHLMPLLDRMSDQLEPEQQERVLDLVLKYQGIFALPDGELVHTTLVQHTFHMAIVGPLNNLLVGCHSPRERLRTEKSTRCWKRATLNPVIAMVISFSAGNKKKEGALASALTIGH